MSQVRAEPPGETAVLRPTGEFWHYLWVPAVFAGLALHLRQDLVFLLGALLIGCAFAAWPLCLRNLRGVVLAREAPARARVGEPAPIRYRASNAGPRPAIGLEIHDLRGRGLAGGSQRLEIACLDPGRSVEGRLEALFARRGRHALPGAVLSSRFPLGLFRARCAAGTSDEVLVHPREGRPTPLLQRRVLEAGAEADLATSRAPGVEDLFGLRDLREGDDPRRIRWRSSARLGRPVVAEWRARRGREVLLALGRGPAQDPAGFERAVSLAASTWRVLQRAGRPALLLVDGRRVRCERRGLTAGLDALALARPAGVARTAARLRRLAAAGGPRHVVVVAAADEHDVLTLAKAAAGRGGLVTRIPAEAVEAARWVEGLA